jgi:cob(I)alamin adenosyltransferase
LKIYTKTGDEGKTSLVGGTRVPKDHIRIECYGTVDELCSWIGLIADQDINEKSKDILIEIQDRLFTIESLLAAEPDLDFELPAIYESDIDLLEKEIDRMNESLPQLRSFILPGGHTTISYCHLARTVCRRAERLIINLKREHDVPDMILKYLNRLSDYLFVLAREFGSELKVPDRLWKPRK